MIKTIIVLGIVVFIAVFALKKLLEQLRGKGGCNCSDCDVESKCNMKK